MALTFSHSKGLVYTMSRGGPGGSGGVGVRGSPARGREPFRERPGGGQGGWGYPGTDPANESGTPIVRPVVPLRYLD